MRMRIAAKLFYKQVQPNKPVRCNSLYAGPSAVMGYPQFRTILHDNSPFQIRKDAQHNPLTGKSLCNYLFLVYIRKRPLYR